MMRNWNLLVVALVAIGLASAASVPPESGVAAPTADPAATASPYASITAGGGFMPSIVVNPPPVLPAVPAAVAVASTPPSIVIVPPTMPPAVAKFVNKIKAAKAALSASMLTVV